MAAKKKAKEVKAWAGFSDGKLHWFIADAGFAWEQRVPAIFKTRAIARKNYSDYRRVVIREVL